MYKNYSLETCPEYNSTTKFKVSEHWQVAFIVSCQWLKIAIPYDRIYLQQWSAIILYYLQ